MRTVSVLWGPFPRAVLERARPDPSSNALEDLVALLDEGRDERPNVGTGLKLVSPEACPFLPERRSKPSSLEVELQRELHAAVVDDRRRDAAGAGVADRGVREPEARMVEQVERVPPEFDVAPAEEAEALRQRRVEIDVSRARRGCRGRRRRRCWPAARRSRGGLNQRSTVGLSSSPEPTRFGQLGAPLLTPVCSDTLNGRPWSAS